MAIYKFSLKLFLLTTVVSSVISQNVLEKFVIDKLENYENWIKEKRLDPSPIVSGPTLIQTNGLFTNIDCYLSNHRVKGHSEGINITSVKADLDRITVSYEIQRNITFSGSYKANGTVYFDIPVNGSGNWNITIPKITFQNIKLDYAISDSGFVYITNYSVDRLTFPSYYERSLEIIFENLWDDEDVAEYEDSIREGLYRGYQTYVTSDEEHPLKKVYLQYFQEIFQNTTWADIIIPSVPQPTSEVTTQEITSPNEDTTDNPEGGTTETAVSSTKDSTDTTGSIGGAENTRQLSGITICLILFGLFIN